MEAVKWLVENGASVENINKGGQTPLMLAAEKEHLNLMKWLHEKGATLDLKDNEGNTTLLFAAYNGHLDAVRWLVENGASVENINKVCFMLLQLTVVFVLFVCCSRPSDITVIYCSPLRLRWLYFLCIASPCVLYIRSPIKEEPVYRSQGDEEGLIIYYYCICLFVCSNSSDITVKYCSPV
eukprot:GHVR01077242.1.p1 GENE.GHVR01077242.1~~GHVR01077242.1.p1  ORF type:complete len:181 (+),score=17.83 GHVR01077242.1:18-560(+)